MDTGTVTQTAGQGAADFLTVLFAWMFTPTGAVLTLLLLAVGGGSVFMKIMGRSMRMLSVAVEDMRGPVLRVGHQRRPGGDGHSHP